MTILAPMERTQMTYQNDPNRPRTGYGRRGGWEHFLANDVDWMIRQLVREMQSGVS